MTPRKCPRKASPEILPRQGLALDPAIDVTLLDRLLRAPSPGMIPIDLLAQQIVVTESAHDALAQLRSAGCELEFHPQRDVRLVRSGLGCWADYLQSGYVQATAGGLPRLFRASFRSTSAPPARRTWLASFCASAARPPTKRRHRR